jgi:hypothetical protein
MIRPPCGGFSRTAPMNSPGESAGKRLGIADNRALLTVMTFLAGPTLPVRGGSAGQDTAAAQL